MPTDRSPRPPRAFGICSAQSPAAFALARTASSTIEADVLVLVVAGRIGFQRHEVLGDEVPDLLADRFDLGDGVKSMV